MKKNSYRYMALEGAHVHWIAEKISNNDVVSIKKWISDHIVNSESNTTAESKGAFYSAIKALISESILKNQYEQVNLLSNSIDGENFNEPVEYQKLTFYQCRVMADAIKASKESLKKNDSMHKDLHALLNNKYSKLTDTDLKSSVSTLIEEALEIVPLVDQSQAK